MVKEFLRERGVVYELKDVNVDPEARAEFVRAGYLLPPVVVVDGVPIPGYDPARLEQLFGIPSDTVRGTND